MIIDLIKRFSEAFGPSGFEEDVARLAASYNEGYEVGNDTMNNVYVLGKYDERKSLIHLDAHMDECGFMVQAINDNGTLSIVSLGGVQASNLLSQTVLIRNRKGDLLRGIIAAKPVHFMSEQECQRGVSSIESLFVDIGAISRQEVEEAFGVSLGDSMVPDVHFSYDEKRNVCLGKSFDNRLGCACLTDVLQRLENQQDELGVNLVGTYSVQEEVGLRGASVVSQTIKPDLAIVFEGTPADDFFVSATQAQGRMKQGAQIRLFDAGHIANPRFVEVAREIATEKGIPFQEAVRRGGGTNAGRLHLGEGGVPTLVISVPARYIHSHHNYCAVADVQAVSDLTVEIIKALDESTVDFICKRDLLTSNLDLNN